MDYSRNKQNNIIGNIYLYQANKALLSEQEQQQAKQQIQINQLAAGIRQSGVAAKVEAKIKELAQDKNFLTQLEDAKKKNQLEQFLMAIANQITVSAGQPTVNTVNTQKNESYELNEALPSRLGSLASAARDRLMGDKPTSNLPLRVQAILKHFEKLKINVGSHLRELQRDMETTSNVDVKVKNLVNQFVADLGDTTAMHGGIAPTQSKLGDIRHAAVAGIAGLKGLGAAAASSALKGGVFESLHSLATGQGIPNAAEVAKIMAVSALGELLEQK